MHHQSFAGAMTEDETKVEAEKDTEEKETEEEEKGKAAQGTERAYLGIVR